MFEEMDLQWDLKEYARYMETKPWENYSRKNKYKEGAEKAKENQISGSGCFEIMQI